MLIIDVTCPFDNDASALLDPAEHKFLKYQQLKELMCLATCVQNYISWTTVNYFVITSILFDAQLVGIDCLKT